MPADSALTSQQCADCAPGSSPLPPADVATLMPQVPGWQIIEGELRRTFKFKNYYESVAFVNATAFISHRENHHPDIELGYNKVTMSYLTHSAKGLTRNDFICAAKINALQG